MHRYDGWDRPPTTCRICGRREHPRGIDLTIVRDAVMALLLVFVFIVAASGVPV